MTENDSELRDYFRIRDEVLLRWELARTDELTDTEVHAELDKLNDNLSSLINVGFGESPVLAEALGLLNRKIELLSESQQKAEFTLHKVNVDLSGSGLGFFWQRTAPNDQIIDVTLRLQPSNLEVTIRTQVLSCDPVSGEEDEGFWIRGQFLPGQDMSVEQIVRHVSFRQTQRLAQKRLDDDHAESDEDDITDD